VAELDSLDLKILDALQEDARITTLELAERVGLSATPCARRVKRLEDEGLIERYVTQLNAERLGIGMNAFITVRLRNQTRQAIEVFERAIRKMPEVVECYLTTGGHDYLVHVRVADIDAFRDFMRNRLTTIESVGATESSIVLEQVKRTTALPLPAAPSRSR
jgi:Lrp/AsnC family transcriptional regulator, leucine-responsive regulatory protein